MLDYFSKEKEICAQANAGKSFLKQFKQEIVGFSGKKLFNTLVGLTENLKENDIYLEIGVYRGKTLLTNAASNPHIRCVGIDNFSLFNELASSNSNFGKLVPSSKSREFVFTILNKYKIYLKIIVYF